MNIFKNKYFLLGNLAFIILAIPVVMYLVKSQTNTISGAADINAQAIKPTQSPVEANNNYSQTNASQEGNILYAIIGGALIIMSIGIFAYAFRNQSDS